MSESSSIDASSVDPLSYFPTAGNLYWTSFVFCVLLFLVLQIYLQISSKSTSTSSSGSNGGYKSQDNQQQQQLQQRISRFQFNFLTVFTLAVFADWLQGPYVYELYVSYGFSQADIALLFVAGFASSLVVGTVTGALADKLGRRALCLVYCLLYSLSGVSKLVGDFYVLLLGRVLAGVSSSLLFSVFECWMLGEAKRLSLPAHALGGCFAWMTTLSGLSAVLAGLAAQQLAGLSLAAPFLAAIPPLVVAALIISFTWTENFGETDRAPASASLFSLSSSFSSLEKGFALLRRDSRVLALGLAQSCFEGAMYTFVFMWTPALKAEKAAGEVVGEEADAGEWLGLVFAVFMVCVMVGSTLFRIFTSNSNSNANSAKARLYVLPLLMHLAATAANLVTALFIHDKFVVYICFLVFEATVGIFYPAYGVIKSERIPEEIRSSVMNIFRIPLNGFVVVLLINIDALSPQQVFYICALTHTLALVCYTYFFVGVSSNKSHEDYGESEVDKKHDSTV